MYLPWYNCLCPNTTEFTPTAIVYAPNTTEFAPNRKLGKFSLQTGQPPGPRMSRNNLSSTLVAAPHVSHCTINFSLVSLHYIY